MSTGLPAGGGYTPLTPARLVDTRAGGSTVDGAFSGGGVVSGGSKLDVTVTGRGGVPSSGVGAVVLNVTAVTPTSTSFVTVWPAGGARPNASNLNVVAGQTVPNLVIAKVGTNGQVSVFNNAGSTHLAIDVAGWFPAPDEAPPLDASVAYQVNSLHDGHLTGGVELPPLAKRWTRNLGGQVSYPVIAEGRVFATAPTRWRVRHHPVRSRRGNGTGRVGPDRPGRNVLLVGACLRAGTRLRPQL